MSGAQEPGLPREVATARLLDGIFTGDELDAEDLAPLTWVVADLIPEGMSMLIGGPKIGKSWLAYDIALAVACGGRVLGSVAVGSARPVLMLALEDGKRRLQARGRQLMQGDPLPPLLSYKTSIEPGTVVATIEAWLDRQDPDSEPLVIVDTLGKVMPPSMPGESAYQRDYRVAGRLKRITDDHPGMALVVLHHDRKVASDDFVDNVSGTNGIAGAVDTILVIVRPRTEERGLIKVTGRDVTEREYAVSTRGGRWQLVGSTLDDAAEAAVIVKTTANLSDRSAEIVRYVATRPEGVRAGEVAEKFGISNREAGTYLGRLFDAGKLKRPERGLYTPVVSVVSVESVDIDDEPDSTDSTHSTAERRPCSVCGFPLAAALVAAGETTHPTCQDST